MEFSRQRYSFHWRDLEGLSLNKSTAMPEVEKSSALKLGPRCIFRQRRETNKILLRFGRIQSLYFYRVFLILRFAFFFFLLLNKTGLSVKKLEYEKYQCSVIFIGYILVDE